MPHTAPLWSARGALSLLLAALLVCGSLLTPAPAHALFGSFGIKDEIELGQKFNLLIRSRMSIVEDPEITSYVEDLGKKLIAVMPPQPFEIKTAVIRHNALNAFAIPGGHVFVHTGLILGFDHESEVAGVLAHELAHVSQRHIAARIEKMQMISLLSLAGMLASIFVGGDDTKQALSVGTMAAGQGALLKYSRDDEREADNVGMNYLVAAGFPPQGLANGFEQIRKKKWYGGGGSGPDYLSTHPGVEERIGYIQQRISRLPSDVVNRPESDERFLKVQMLIRARYTEPQDALAYFSRNEGASPCLNALGRGIALSRLNQVTEADTAFQEAMACGSKDSLWPREAGRFYFTTGDSAKAGRYLQQAAIMNPDDLMALFFYARLLGETGQVDQASEYFDRILATIPQDAEVHYYYGRLLGEHNQLFQAHRHLTYSALYNNDRRQTLFHLDKARSLARTDQEKKELEQLEATLKEREEFW